MRLFLTVLLVLGALGRAYPQAATLPRPVEPLPPIMLEWVAAQSRLGDIQVGFTQTRTAPALKAPVVSNGQFWRFGDGTFRWQLGQPPVTVLVHDASEFRVQEAPGGPWVVLDAKDGRYRMWAQFLSGRDASTEDLSRSFTAKVIATQSDAVTVVLVPRPLAIRRYLKQLELQIVPATKLLRQLRVSQGDGATLTMQFSNPKPVSTGKKAELLAR